MILSESNSGKLDPSPSTVHHYGYAVVGSDFRLRKASPSFQRLVGECQIGVQIDEILPVFAGMEATLTEIVKVELPFWYLQNVAHSQADERYPRFFHILVLPNRQEDGLFVTIRDVTAEAEIVRRAVQERNEARLLARR